MCIYYEEMPILKSFSRGCIVELYQFGCTDEHRNTEIDTMGTYKIARKQGISRFVQSDLLDFGANCGNIETAQLDILHLFLTIAGNR